MRISVRLSRNTRLSTGLGAWVLTWIMLSPAIALWLAGQAGDRDRQGHPLAGAADRLGACGSPGDAPR
jgi:hypothetical protein